VLIQGPPGTGKTHTLALAIEQLVAQNKRVIISAPSNTAVDNLSHELLARKIAILRVGNEEKMSAAVQPYTIDGYLERGSEKKLIEHLQKALRKADDAANKYLRNYTKEAATERQEARKERTSLRREIRKAEHDAKQHLLATIPVIAGTPVGLFNELPKDFQADVVVIDEAGQCLEPLAWLTASFGKRLIVCGDPQQLPPVVFSKKAQQLGLGRSLLETAMATGNGLLLNEQYRMAPEIVAAINPYFYDNQLITHFTERTGELRFVDMAGFGEGEQQDETTGSTFHPDEVQLIKILATEQDLRPETTVILSPYNAQLGLLKTELPHFRSSTIDAIQGQEEETVVISLTRSNPDQEIGFLKDYRRTNVAISRAKTRCIIVGDSSTLASDPFYLELIDFIETNGVYQSAWEFAS
jgi:superfamily I DNA and/or RNA helicase